MPMPSRCFIESRLARSDDNSKVRQFPHSCFIGFSNRFILGRLSLSLGSLMIGYGLQPVSEPDICQRLVVQTPMDNKSKEISLIKTCIKVNQATEIRGTVSLLTIPIPLAPFRQYRYRTVSC